MADNTRLLYQLSEADSTLWQQGGPAALAFQHQLAELHRQGSLGLMPILEVVHPDGILAAQHLAYVPHQGQVAGQVEQTPALAQAQAPAPVRVLGRAAGSLIETATVTAYQMSATESAAWSRGDHEARMVEANIGDALKDVTTAQPVAVLLDDGRAAYTHNGSIFQTMTDALSALRGRLSTLAQGVQVHMDVSVQFGALQQRADRLTTSMTPPSQAQGMTL